MAKGTINGILLKIGIAITTVIFAAGGFYLLTDYRLDTVEVDVKEAEADIESVDARVDLVEDITSIIQNDLNYIRADLVEQKALSKEILKELRK